MGGWYRHKWKEMAAQVGLTRSILQLSGVGYQILFHAARIEDTERENAVLLVKLLSRTLQLRQFSQWGIHSDAEQIFALSLRLGPPIRKLSSGE